jgi:hypothetical protein
VLPPDMSRCPTHARVAACRIGIPDPTGLPRCIYLGSRFVPFRLRCNPPKIASLSTFRWSTPRRFVAHLLHQRIATYAQARATPATTTLRRKASRFGSRVMPRSTEANISDMPGTKANR